MLVTNYNNNKNTVGFSALEYNKDSLAKMPKKFQNAFKKALPKLQKKSQDYNSTLVMDFIGDQVHCARFDVNKTKTVTVNDIPYTINGTNKEGLINILKATPGKIKKTFDECIKSTNENITEKLETTVESILRPKKQESTIEKEGSAIGNQLLELVSMA